MAKNFMKLPFATGSVKKYRGAGGLNRTPKKKAAPQTQKPVKRVSEREQLVKDTNKRLDQAVKKMIRHQVKGVNIFGSSFNPVKKKLPENMSMGELRAYKADLDSFMHRSRQYEADAFGNPIPAAAMRAYKQAERRYNKHVERELKKIANIKLPHMDMTLGDRMEKVVGASRYQNMTNGMNRLSQLNRNSSAFFSAEALAKAIKNMRKKTDPDYQSRSAQANRNSWNALVEYADRKELKKLTDMLTDAEFQTLADYSPMFVEARSNYSQWLRYQSDKENAATFQSQVDDLYDMIEDQMRHIIENRVK